MFNQDGFYHFDCHYDHDDDFDYDEMAMTMMILVSHQNGYHET